MDICKRKYIKYKAKYIRTIIDLNNGSMLKCDDTKISICENNCVDPIDFKENNAILLGIECKKQYIVAYIYKIKLGDTKNFTNCSDDGNDIDKNFIADKENIYNFNSYSRLFSGKPKCGETNNTYVHNAYIEMCKIIKILNIDNFYLGHHEFAGIYNVHDINVINIIKKDNNIVENYINVLDIENYINVLDDHKYGYIYIIIHDKKQTKEEYNNLISTYLDKHGNKLTTIPYGLLIFHVGITYHLVYLM